MLIGSCLRRRKKTQKKKKDKRTDTNELDNN
jgi:hypothetical protein